MHNTNQVIQRCIAGDTTAFAHIVDHHKLMVYNIVHRMMHNEDLADDLSQEVFLRVYRGLASFQGKSKLSTWIYRIAYRVCLEESERAHRRQTFVSIDADQTEHTQFIQTEDRAFHQVDARASIDHYLSALPPKYKMVLNLYYLLDRSYQEIAEIMDIPEGTVKTYLHRARKMLESQMKREKDCHDDL